MKKNKGFTIIEVVAALVILSIVAIPLAKVFIDAFKFQARSQIKTEATKVIQYVAEQFKMGEYLGLDLNSSDSLSKTINKISGKNLSNDYNVNIDILSRNEEEANSVAGTPDNYDVSMYIDETGNTVFEGNGVTLNLIFENSVLDISRISNPLNGEFYTIYISNSYVDSIEIRVNKLIEDRVKIYKQGNTINLRTYPNMDPSISRTARLFEQINLGEKENIESKNEVLCKAAITATNTYDNTITANMEITFNLEIPE